MPSVTSELRGFGCRWTSLTDAQATRVFSGSVREDGGVSEYVAPRGYAVVAPDWDRELRRPVLLRCDRCAALVLGAGDAGTHDAWHAALVPQPRVSPA
jgi:hypothetical protein